MEIKIHPPLPFQEQGKRDYQEDYIYPTTLDEATRLFVVCDGMGGLDKGEVASQTVADAIGEFVAQNPTQLTDTDYIQQAVTFAHDRLQSYLDNNPALSRMGTTLTLVYLHADSVTVAHIGDSRVYQIRNGGILYKTQDHKQVTDMVREGIITPEQAVNHPWRNRLSRSVSVNKDDKHRADKAAVVQITDVAAGDYFVLCTDGVLEQITDEILCEILKSDQPNEVKKQAILTQCQDQTRDNYSGVLIQIASSGIAQPPIKATTAAIATPVPTTNSDAAKKSLDRVSAPTSNSRYGWLGGLLVVLGLGALLYCFWQPKPAPTTKPKPTIHRQHKPIAPPDKLGNKSKNV